MRRLLTAFGIVAASAATLPVAILAGPVLAGAAYLSLLSALRGGLDVGSGLAATTTAEYAAAVACGWGGIVGVGLGPYAVLAAATWAWRRWVSPRP
ncbi:hypothetical protein [Azospirillum brasilense]|uniref:Uncharacterized protein n=1 Tax=Azospirillum brasilense TaxID=192 RepID=A0A6L3B3G1_AZOBR|nr:hypothetical protein [Azospirillum brasilense]KAA0686608.1 hypothetical protein DS837_09110 [Azospirillum brasilense]